MKSASGSGARNRLSTTGTDILIRFNVQGKMWYLMQEKYGCQAPGCGIYEKDILDYSQVYMSM